MSIRRVVPDIQSDNPIKSREFYTDFLGFDLVMDMDWILTFASPTNPTAQISVMRDNASAEVLPDISVEVEDVDAMYAAAVQRGLVIVHPLTDEPWGVRRFLVTDPDGTIINVLSHRSDVSAS